MHNDEAHFQALAEQFSSSDPNIHLGRMMSSPGLKYQDKVFAFFHKGAMGFRLGPNFDAEKFGIRNARPLSPFKTKPPLKGWFVVDSEESDLWAHLIELALDYTQTLK